MSMRLADTIDLNTHGAVEASAGTGKTSTIAGLVGRLVSVSDGRNPEGEYHSLENILLVTFTEKAAGELRSRVKKELEKLKAETPQDKDPELWAHLKLCLQNYHLMPIHTLHGFCQSVLRDYSAYTGQPLRTELVAEADVAREALEISLRESPEARELLDLLARGEERPAFKNAPQWLLDYVPLLAQFQREAGDDFLPRRGTPGELKNYEKDFRAAALELWELAGMTGDGVAEHPLIRGYRQLESCGLKKAGITRKINNFLLPCLEGLQEVYRRNSLAQNPPGNFGAGRLKKKPNESGPDVNPDTEYFENFSSDSGSDALKSLRQFCLSQGTKTNAEKKILPALLEKITSPFATALETWDGALPFSLIRFFETWDVLKEKAHQWEEALNPPAYWEVVTRWLGDCLSRMDRFKETRGLITYNDMIARVHRLLSGEESVLLHLLRRRFHTCIIDEFQDTNRLQWDIFYGIFRAAGHKLYVVGDPKQSIFSFQGSDLQVYRRAVGELLEAEHGKPYLADVNFRSSAGLVRAYNAVFRQASWFGGNTEGLLKYRDVTPHSQNPNPQKPDRWADAPVWLKNFAHISQVSQKREAVAKWIASTIKQRLGHIAPGDVAVLYAAEKDVQPVCRSLAREGIPFTLVRESGLFQSEECLHLMFVLEAVARPWKEALVRKALLTPYFAASPFQIRPERAYAALPEIEAMFSNWHGLAMDKSWSRLFAEMDTHTHYRLRLYTEPDRDRRANRYRQLISGVLEKIIGKNLGINQVLSLLSRYYRGEEVPDEGLDTLARESGRQAVQLLTIHKSKGLEFPVVFVAGGLDGMDAKTSYLRLSRPGGGFTYALDKGSPAAKWRHYRDALAEKKRMYYVALTRASEALFLPVHHGALSHRSLQMGKTNTSLAFLSPALLDAQKEQGHLETGNLEQGNIGPGNLRPGALIQWDEGQPFAGGPPEKDPGATAKKAPATPAKIPRKDPGQTPAQPMDLASWFEYTSKSFPKDLPSHNGHLRIPRLERRQVVQTSYSALAHAASLPYTVEGRLNREDRKTFRPDQPETPELPGGSHTGTALHEILEEISFERAGQAPHPAALLEDPECRQIISACWERQGLSSIWLNAVAEIVWKALHTSLPDAYAPEDSFRLHQVSDKKPELEFHFTFDETGLPFPTGKHSGYVIGYIDLIWRWKGRYYLLDWKSNRLENYGTGAVWENMEQEQYTTQSLLYCMAVHRWLAKTLPGYRPEEHFGGVYYLYLRGLKPGSPDGINVYRPTREMLEEDFPRRVRELLQGSHLKTLLEKTG